MINIKKNDIKFSRYKFILSSIIIVFGIYFYRLIDWQIINTEYYSNRASNTNIYTVKTDAFRGEIFDANGKGLAINDTLYRIILNRAGIQKDDENQIILNIVNLLDKTNNNWIDVLPIEIINDNFEFSENKSSQVNGLKKYLDLTVESTAKECIEKLIKKYNCEEYSKRNQRVISSIRYNMDKQGVYNSKFIPYILAEKVDKKTASIFSEYFDLQKCIKIEPYNTRVYPNGTVAPHILGYVGQMSSEEYKKYKDSYSLDDAIGKTGIEKSMEKYLKGKKGKKIIQISSDGEIINSSIKEESIPGNNVYLTISSELQEVVNDSLKRNIELAQSKGVKDCKAGAAVVLNVKDFSVLAAGTYPSYDVSKIVNDSEYYNELLSEEKNNPLLNRCFAGAFPPGSTYKVLVACAAFQENIITPDDTIKCNGKYNYYKGYTLRCMGYHGNISLINALSKSCNVYFAELGRRLGAEMLEKYAKKFGFGTKTGIELYEINGIIAGPTYSKKVGKEWYDSGNSQSAIGQSDNMITPLQLAVYVATIANNGKRLRPHIIKKINDFKNQNTIIENSSDNPEDIEDIGVSEENLNIVKKGMREVAVNGTARNFKNYPIEISAKTGTAENIGSDHTIFICFAPSENPEIAISVVIVNGKYGVISNNVAKDILNCYFKIDK